MANKGKLYLIPTLLGNSSTFDVLPPLITKIINEIDVYIVENERSARRYLKLLNPNFDINSVRFYTLNKHTDINERAAFLDPIATHNIGVISESGCPAIADPGAKVVEMAHKKNITVVPLVGPSSLLLALMASGMNGQSFAFNGYLPIKDNRKKVIKEFENLIKKNGQSQLFIETPYRNQSLFNDIIQTCNPNTRLCLAINVTLSNENISTKTILEWKNISPNFHKMPCVFILGI